MLDVIVVRGTVDEPLDERGMDLYEAGSKVIVVRRLIEVVGDGQLFGEFYLARVTYADKVRPS